MLFAFQRLRLFSVGPLLPATRPGCYPTVLRFAHRTPGSSKHTLSQKYYQPEGVESLSAYQPGGYHPVNIDGVLNQRYRVVHKLGYGSFSTIWLAEDQLKSAYLAVKIGIAGGRTNECRILTRLSKGARRADTFFLAPVLDHFDVLGDNGSHPCMVTTPAKCSLAQAKKASSEGLFQPRVARSLCAQLIKAVACVHDGGFVHGDLHLGNILLRLPATMDDLSKQDIYDTYGSPKPQSVRRVDGQPLSPNLPRHVYSPGWFGQPSENIVLREAKLFLVDFGVAFAPSEEVRLDSFTPLGIRPPEALFEPNKPLSFASDVWSLACTMWEVLGYGPLLDSFLFGVDDATEDQIDLLGPLPTDWWDKWKGREGRFVANGQARPGRSVWTWDQRFEDSIQQPRRELNMDVVSDQEAVDLFALLRWMLAFRPEDRPTAAQVLSSEWMSKWALPDCEETFMAS